MDVSPISFLAPIPSRASENAGVGGASGNDPGAAQSATGEPLTKEQQQQVEKLKRRDAEVRAHEQAHAQVGGTYAGAPKYQYTQGPDGKKYATSGEVQIDVSPERTPEATIRKMDVVIRAALAPAEPSSQDQAVARQAQATKQQAQAEAAKQQTEELQSGPPGAEQETEAGEPNAAASLAFQAAAQAYQAAAKVFGG